MECEFDSHLVNDKYFSSTYSLHHLVRSDNERKEFSDEKQNLKNHGGLSASRADVL